LVRRWKFTALLVALVLLLVVRPFVSGDAALFMFLYTLFLVVYLVAVLILFQRRTSRLAAAVLGIPTLVGILTYHLFPEESPGVGSLLFHVFAALFLLFTVVAILRTIFLEADVSADSGNGAFCGYLLLGLAFAHLYSLVDSFWPDSFTLKESLGTVPRQRGEGHSLFTYFSLVTLTTLGFGDITPKSDPARALTWLEAMMGQFYVAVIIAELIALKVSAAMRAEQADR